MLRMFGEVAAYGSLAVLLALATLAPTDPSSASSARAADSVARGRVLFAAMGCIGCHTHVAAPTASLQIGPDLTTLSERAASRVPSLDANAYVRQSITEPAAFIAPGYDGKTMPTLLLPESDVEALVTFLLKPAP
jgi:mono/diheme cytochrome c family protein